MQEFVNDDAGIVAMSAVAASRQSLIDLSAMEIDGVGGGNIFNVIGATRLGWDIGSYIDRRFIAPLWY